MRGGYVLVSIVASENEFCQNSTSKDTMTIIKSESHDSIGGHKHLPDQHTYLWKDEFHVCISEIIYYVS